MNDSLEANPYQTASAASIFQRSWILRFFRWVFTPRVLGRIACVLLSLATLVVLFYVEEKVRGRWAWNRYREALEKQGLSVDIKTVKPPALAEDANFARSPALKTLYDYTSQQKRPLGKDYEQFQERLNEPQKLAQKLGYAQSPNMGGTWRKSAWPDPYKMLGEPRKGAKVEPPASPEKAAELVLDIYRQTTGPLIDALQAEAQKRRYSNFDINYDTDDPFAILLPYLAHWKGLGQQSATRAVAELRLKQPEAAFRDTLFCLHMSETLKDDPILISFLVSVALREIGISAVWYGLGTRQWNARQLEELQARIEGVNMLSQVRRALNWERVLGQRGIDGFARQFPHKMTFATLGSSMEEGAPRSMEGEMLDKVLSYLYPKGWLYFESINYQRLFVEHLLRMAPSGQERVDLKALDQAAKAMEQELEGPPVQAVFRHQMLSRLLLPALARVMNRAVNSHMAGTMAATACALERFRLDHGKLPQALTELTPKYLKQAPIDAIDGQPLRYKVDAEGSYELYSIASNGVDEGGKVVLFDKSGNVNQQEGDWVWKYPAGR